MSIAIRIGIVLAVVIVAALAIGTCNQHSKLNRYCSGKDPSGGYIYGDCMDGGWQDWYENASWMR